jgi:hypothetical protein
MTDKKIVVTKKEVGPIWDNAEEQVTILWELLNRIYKYSNWVTNLSIGLLCFFFALLFQIKTSTDHTLQINSTIVCIFVYLGLSIIIGFYIRIRFEIVDAYRKFKTGFSILNQFLYKSADLLEEKGEKIHARFDLKIKLNKMDEFVKNYPIRLLFIQFLSLVFSLLNISIFLFKYLFY